MSQIESQASRRGIQAVTVTRCVSCNTAVYPVEMLSVESQPYHKACFRCKHCNKVLTMSNFAMINGLCYCKPHYIELFKSSGGRYDVFGDSGAQTRRSEEHPRPEPATSSSSASSGASSGANAVHSGDSSAALASASGSSPAPRGGVVAAYVAHCNAQQQQRMQQRQQFMASRSSRSQDQPAIARHQYITSRSQLTIGRVELKDCPDDQSDSDDDGGRVESKSAGQAQITGAVVATAQDESPALPSDSCAAQTDTGVLEANQPATSESLPQVNAACSDDSSIIESHQDSTPPEPSASDSPISHDSASSEERAA